MEQIILFTFLILFPFGKIIKIGQINPIDIVVFLGAITVIIKRYKYPKYFNNFLLVALFSYLLSVFIIKNSQVAVGFLYLVRLTAYLYFCLFLKGFKDKKLLINSLLSLSLVSAFFGWFQYFIYPDLTSLKYLGWDDHLYRLAGTFLDPGFTSLIIVFGAILSFIKKKYLLLAFFIITLAFTYSRAGYLAFAVSLFLASLIFKKFKIFLISIASFLIVIFLLPTPAGEGVNLARTYSISSRLENYQETFEIFKKSPVFGVGFNNICLYKGSTDSHSCSGSDSSLLLILATTGTVGFIVFVSSISKILLNLNKGFYSKTFLVILSAVFIHSLFVNSLFYPWIMGYLAISASLIEE
ncbi:MAG: O-antigen ligase family protein [Patescibacteria group bacterium]